MILLGETCTAGARRRRYIGNGGAERRCKKVYPLSLVSKARGKATIHRIMGDFRGHARSSQGAAGSRDGGHSVSDGATAEGSEGAEERVSSVIRLCATTLRVSRISPHRIKRIVQSTHLTYST